MTWRGASTVQDRIFGGLPYLLPLVESLSFGAFLFREFPLLELVIKTPLAPILILYSTIPFIGLIVFFALFMLVIRNENISHFIRFNTMQAVLIDIVLVLCNVIVSFFLQPTLGSIGSSGFLFMEVLFNVVFFGVLAAVGYSWVQVIRGAYPDKIPSLSEIVYMQVR